MVGYGSRKDGLIYVASAATAGLSARRTNVVSNEIRRYATVLYNA